MKNTALENSLSSINSFSDYEKLKTQIEIFEKMAEEIIIRHQLPISSLTLFSEGTNIVFAYGDHSVIKIFPPFHADHFKSELLILKQVQDQLSVKTPAVKFHGTLANWPYIIMTKLEGELLETLWDTLDHSNKMLIIRELGQLIREVHALPTQGLEEIDCHWEEFIHQQINHCQEQHQSHHLPNHLLQEIPPYLASIKASLLPITKPVILTGEYTPMNMLVTAVNGVWHITGLIDFGDGMLGRAEYDLLGPGAFLIQGDKTLLTAFLAAYGYSQDKLTPTLRHQLMAFMLLHKYSNLNIQIRIKDWQNKVRNLHDLENLIWGF